MLNCKFHSRGDPRTLNATACLLTFGILRSDIRKHRHERRDPSSLRLYYVRGRQSKDVAYVLACARIDLACGLFLVMRGIFIPGIEIRAEVVAARSGSCVEGGTRAG